MGRNKSHEKILTYYDKMESLGYKIINKGAKHFGFYPDGTNSSSMKIAQRRMTREVADQLGLKKGQRVLDAGTGFGVSASQIANEYGVEVIGVDLNERELKEAKHKYAKTSEFAVADYTNLPLSDNSIDAVYTMETLSHAEDLKAVLKEFLRVLKPGGKICFSEYTLDQDISFSHKDLETMNIIIDGTATFGLKNFRHGEFIEVLKELGFKNSKERDITRKVIPGLKKYRKLAVLPYFLIKMLKKQKKMVNTTIGAEWLGFVNKGLVKHMIFSAEK